MSKATEALEAMTSSGKRALVHDQTIPVKHPSTVRGLVKKVAADRGVTESAVWREAMGEYLTKRGYNR